MSFHNDPTTPLTLPVLPPVRPPRSRRWLPLVGILALVCVLALISGVLISFWQRAVPTAVSGQKGTPLARPSATVIQPTAPATRSSVVSNGAVTLAYQNGNQAVTTNQIQPSLKLTNTGSSPLALTNVTIRYWYTADSAQQQVFACDYATIDCQNVRYRFVQLGSASPRADTYLELSFTGGELAAEASTEIKARVHKSDWSNYNQSNDYSFLADAENYSPAQRIGVYYQGKLLSGSEP